MTTLFNGGGDRVGGGGRDPAQARGTRWVRRGRRRTPPTGARKRSNGPPRRTRLALFFRVVVASVKGVLDVKVDASVAIAGGKKRYIYDYHATVENEISDRGGRSHHVRFVEAARGAQREYVLREEEEELEVEVLAWKCAPSFPSWDDDIGASITVQEASNVEGYSSRTSGRAFWDSWRSSTHKIPRTSMGADAATTITATLTIQHNNQIIQGRGGGRGW